DKYGLADQVGWKNIRHAEVRLEVSPLRGWRFDLKQHAWWLVSARDGVYTAGGALISRDPTGRSGRYVGRETDIQAIWVASPQLSIGMGLARLSPGEFLKKTTPGATLIYPYVMVTYGF
ncbi:MAG TPA: alginate export family protein, partial [Verrucomicrobiae bacterium]|nr:alginate export family protein [Verrucomicrobiae bacterium]